MSTDFAVEMRHISKYFGNFCALNDVSLSIRKGEIHALLGENGAGNTTLMNILYGLLRADKGEILINGKECAIKNPGLAIKAGIGMVHQHFKLVKNFTVTENIILGSETTTRFGFIDKKRARAEIMAISEKYGLAVEPDMLIKDISVGMQQRVEILKALYRGTDILILDEPTAVLIPQEIDELIEIMHRLVKSGKTILIITHKLKEILRAADVCTIVAHGRYIDTVNVSETTEQELAEKMVGRTVNLTVTKTPAVPGEKVLEIKDLHVQDARGIERVKGLDLTVRAGEIVGIAGVDGNGQKELVEAITNLCHVKSGEILVHGKHIENSTPRKTIEAGVSTIHEDRERRGIVPQFSVAENMIIENFADSRFSSHGILRKNVISAFTEQLVKRFDVRPENCASLPVGALSGGNKQKVIIARELTNEPELLVAVQPTRGLDVGAIEFVHKSLVAYRDKGKAVLLISFELDEVISVSDSIAVLYDGRIAKTLPSQGADEKEIGLLMTGGTGK